MNKQLKTTIVVLGAIVFSTLAINASDILRGLDGSLSGLAIDGISGPCGADAIFLQFGETTICMDTYEASPDEKCPVAEPVNGIETIQNLKDINCVASSKNDVMPWRFVTLSQAQQLCARTQKRLPTNEEWYKAVIGSSDISGCVTNNKGSSPDHTGKSSCSTPAGVKDMVGNVWEWIDGEIVDGVFDDKILPKEGYVALVDSKGMVIETSLDMKSEFGGDYAWFNNTGVRGLLRGGFYGSGSDAGIFTMNASVPLDFKAAGVGFRCVKDI